MMSWALKLCLLAINLTTILIGMAMASPTLLWICLELNLLSFVGVIMVYNKSVNSLLSMKYFCTQASASLVLFWSLMNFWDYTPLYNFLMITALFMKLGAAPFHGWFVSMTMKSSWQTIFIMSTFQKILPLWFMSFLFISSPLIQWMISFSAVISSALGLTQFLIKKIFAYSSVFALTWMVSSMLFSKIFWVQFLIIYTLLIFIFILVISPLHKKTLNQMISPEFQTANFKLLTLLLVLGGIPPLAMFSIKVNILVNLSALGLSGLALLLTLSSVLMMFMYLSLINNSLAVKPAAMSLNKTPVLNSTTLLEGMILVFTSYSVLFMLLQKSLSILISQLLI